MIPRALLLPLLAVGLLSLGACKDKEPEPQTIPVSSAAPPTAPVAADQAPSAAPAAPAGSEAAAAPTAPAPADTPATPQPTGQKGGGASIDACCAGLMAINASGRSADAKAKAGTAHKICLGLAKRVKEGEVAKPTAIATIKATLGDVTAPAECK